MSISNFFYLETEFYYEKGLCTDLIMWSRLKQTKSENNIRLGTSERKALINPYSTRFYSACTRMG